MRPCLARNKRFVRAGCVLVAVGFLVPGPCGSRATAEDLHQTAQALIDKYADRLSELADWCDQCGLTEPGQETRSWLRPRNPDKLYVIVLPKEVGGGPPAADTPAEVAEWRNRFERLKRDQTEAMFELSRRAMVAHRASLAFDLLMGALRENPDHDSIRRILGYQKYRGRWCTRFEVDKLRNGQVWHETFGWLPRAYVKRYEQGERLHGSRWITAEEDARLRREINSGWDVETEHYTIRTNHSLETGVDMGRQLERLYRVWKQLFVRFYATEDQVAALFAGSKRRGPPIRLQNRHAVVYFRDREDYNRTLSPVLPNVEISIGVYVDTARRAYFFASEDHEERTLLHEAAHQLFHESRPVAPGVGSDHNYWIIEGIAMYLESLRDEDGYHVLGGFDDLRMEAARYRLLSDNFYVPLSELTTYGIDQVKADKRIGTLYSQAAGLTHFLIHYDHGRYRDALVAYLTAVYSGRADPGTLARLTGASHPELDRQYREFMEKGPQAESGGESR